MLYQVVSQLPSRIDGLQYDIAIPTVLQYRNGLNDMTHTMRQVLSTYICHAPDFPLHATDTKRTARKSTLEMSSTLTKGSMIYRGCAYDIPQIVAHDYPAILKNRLNLHSSSKAVKVNGQYLSTLSLPETIEQVLHEHTAWPNPTAKLIERPPKALAYHRVAINGSENTRETHDGCSF